MGTSFLEDTLSKYKYYKAIQKNYITPSIVMVVFFIIGIITNAYKSIKIKNKKKFREEKRLAVIYYKFIRVVILKLEPLFIIQKIQNLQFSIPIS